MPAPVGAPESRPPQVNRMEAFAFNARANARKDFLPVQVERGQTRAERLQAVRQKTNDREMFRRALKPKEQRVAITTDISEGMKARFGAGAAELNGQGRAELKLGVSVGQENSHRLAAAAVERSTTVLGAIEVLTDADPATRFQVLQREGRLPAGVTTPQELELKAVDIISSDETFQNMFQDLFSGGIGPNMRREAVREMILKDPSLRGKIADKMTRIYDKALDLQEVQGSPDQKALAQKAEAEKSHTEKVKAVADLLKQKGVTGFDEADVTQIIESSQTGAEAQWNLIGRITGINAQGLEQVRFRLRLEQQITSTHEERLVLLKQGADVTQLTEKMQKLAGDLGAAMNGQGPEGQENYDKYKGLAPLLTEGVTEQNPQGTLMGNLRSAHELSRQIPALQKAAEAAKAQGGGDSREQAKRLLQERELIGDLEGVIGESLVEVMEERYDEAIGLDQQLMEQDAVAAAEKQLNDIARGIREVQKSMRENWVKYDPKTRKRSIDKEQIGLDMQDLAYNGKEGLRRMILGELAGSKPPLINLGNDPDGKPYTYETVDLDAMSAEQKAILDGVYNSSAEPYRKKLFADFVYARKSVWRKGDMNLKDHEWAMLEQNFRTELSTGLEKSKEAGQIMKALEADKIKPESKKKWALYMLLLSFFGPLAIPGIIMAEKRKKSQQEEARTAVASTPAEAATPEPTPENLAAANQARETTAVAA
jgi:hypothetical protein